MEDDPVKERALGLWSNYTYFWNSTFDQADEFTSQLRPASDVSVHAVMSSLYFNAIIFVFLLASYEILRRIIPSVYAARKLYAPEALERPASGIQNLPFDSYMPLDWVAPVFGVSWLTVRKTAGLDAYFFLRFIRMCVRITAVSTFWALVILAPTYATGSNGASGWYHVSMTNVKTGSWRMMIPIFFIYLFSAFTYFVMKQEFSHWMELRMDFLGRGEKNVNPQHHFSLMIENIPQELRSDKALFEYFDRLFPNKVHSASVILNLPVLEDYVRKQLRVVKRLEKAIAYYHATGKRPTHIMGQFKSNFLGIEIEFSFYAIKHFFCGGADGVVHIVGENGVYPPPGSIVDSISCYTMDVAICNKKVQLLQKQREIVAENGASSPSGRGKWLINAVDAATNAATMIMDESIDDNGLRSPSDVSPFGSDFGFRVENMTSRYGSFGAKRGLPTGYRKAKRKCVVPSRVEGECEEGEYVEAVASFASLPSDIGWSRSVDSDRGTRLVTSDHLESEMYATSVGKHLLHPSSRQGNFFRRLIGRLGLDFLVAVLKYVSHQLDLFYANVVGTTMSSTGFVTFLDLTSVATAASTPLTHKPNVLKTTVAPEPRDIRWKSAHRLEKMLQRREIFSNIFLSFGIVLWSIPLTAIQAFATAEQVARIPGMDWVLTIEGGSFTSFINGYLPVIALLGLIMLLPILFEQIAINYEHRKTVSDVQRSMLGRYFYYQLANIYLTVTAGSFWESVADVLDHPGNILEILGRSLPKVVGYFISLLITKILAGLPIIVLRVGALSRMLFLRGLFSKDKVTQREMDFVFRRENLLYGWEYPSQLLVIVICFTYACICPIILPFGAIYFVGSLMVYKKQALYVYIPLYESGGAMFPDACGYMLFGLLCSQMTLLGYCVIRQCFYEPLMLMPLPFITIWVSRYFRRNFGEAARQLSLERAVERDRVSNMKAMQTVKRDGNGNAPSLDERRTLFDRKLYRQPVLTAAMVEPLSYRRNEPDVVTDEAKASLKRIAERLSHAEAHPVVIPEEPCESSDHSIYLSPSNRPLHVV